MSVNQSVLACVPSSVTKSNAESSAAAALETWKDYGVGPEWNQETADEVGLAASKISVQWTNAVIPDLDAEIDKWKAEYDEKRSNYEAAKKEKEDANREWHSYEKKEADTIKSDGGFGQQDQAGGGAGTTYHTVITNPVAYADAKNREKKAEAEMNRWKSQMDSAKDKLDDAKDKKHEEQNKIQKFILDVYEINLMNESVPFLSAVKNSGITLDGDVQKKLFGRLFFIQNVYRKQFEAFEKTITDTSDKYKNSNFDISPDSLTYTAERRFKAKKFKGKIDLTLLSETSNTASLTFAGKNDFIIPKAKTEKAKSEIENACKNYELSVNRSNFTLILNKVSKDNEIIEEVEKLNSKSDEYTNEGIALLDKMLENGASASKIRVLIGKISNWHLDHWSKLWYKIVCYALCAFVAAGLIFGAVMGISGAIKQSNFEKSFVEWHIENDKETKQLSFATRRFLTGNSELTRVVVDVLKEEEIQDAVDWLKNRHKAFENKCYSPTEEEIQWLKENLFGLFASDTTLTAKIRIQKSSGDTEKASGSRRGLTSIEGVISIKTSNDGSITEISDITSVGFFDSYRK